MLQLNISANCPAIQNMMTFVQYKPSGELCPGSFLPGPPTPYQGLRPEPNWGRALIPYAPRAKNKSRRLMESVVLNIILTRT